MIDWNKPIEFSAHGDVWSPARLICQDRKPPVDGVCTHVILYGGGFGRGEDTYLVTPKGTCSATDTKTRVRNVKQKKKFWTYIYMLNGIPNSVTHFSDQGVLVGGNLTFGSGSPYKVINIIEGEYEV